MITEEFKWQVDTSDPEEKQRKLEVFEAGLEEYSEGKETYDHIQECVEYIRASIGIELSPSSSSSSLSPETAHFLTRFRYDHLPLHLQGVSAHFYRLAHEMVDILDDGPELGEGLRKLWEAKNCFVFQAVDTHTRRTEVDEIMRQFSEDEPS